MKKIKLLFSPDYDISILSKLERDSVGSAYRNKQKWFNGWLIIFFVTFAAVVVGYMLGNDGRFGEEWKAFVLQPVVGISVIIYLALVFVPTMILLWALPQYGKNSKKAVVDYYVEQSQHCAARLKQSKYVALSKVGEYWPKLSKKKRQDLIIDAYKACTKSGDVNEEFTDEFLEILNLEEIAYRALPGWAASRIVVYDSLHYWYAEAKERADGIVQALAFKKA